MTERPILFSAPMVRAILDGKKTQTRRLVKPQPQMVTDMRTQPWDGSADVLLSLMTKAGKTCPYGQPGDQLWVREAHAIVPRTAYAQSEGVQQTLRPDDPYEHDAAIYREGWTRSKGGFSWRPSIHMPRWASRITLEITSVRVERLQDIGESGAMAEGATQTDGGWWTHDRDDPITGNDPVESFRRLWEHLNGPESWATNPWVWVVEFTRTK